MKRKRGSLSDEAEKKRMKKRKGERFVKTMQKVIVEVFKDIEKKQKRSLVVRKKKAIRRKAIFVSKTPEI